MKNFRIVYHILGILVFFGLMSCSDREIITADTQTAPVVLDLSASTLYLDSNFPSNTALTVSWNRAGYTVPMEVKYAVEISSTADFAAPVQVGQTNDKYVSFTNKELNEKAKLIGLVPYTAQKMYIRVKSYLGNGDLTQVSNVTSLTITPYLASPTYNFVDLYLIGDSTAAGWTNSADNNSLIPLLKTSTAGVYTFTGYFLKAKDGFKFIQEKGSWDKQYGYGGTAGTLSTDGGSSNLTVPEDGYYKLTVNTNSLTYSIESVAAPTTTYTSISIIGTVNGNWDTDTALVQSTFDPHLWTLHNVALKSGQFKFRANNAWDVSWGVNNEFYGTTTKGGENIPLNAEWTYDVYFNDATGDYSVIPVK